MIRYRHGQYAELIYDLEDPDSLSEVVQIDEAISEKEIVVRFLNTNDTLLVNSDRLGMPFGILCEH